MNNFSEILINHIKNNKIKFKKNKFIVFDVGAYKGTFSRELNKKLKLKKKLIFHLFDPLKSYVKFDDRTLNKFNYHQIAF